MSCASSCSCSTRSVNFKGSPLALKGNAIEAGINAPNCTLVKTDMSECQIQDFKGKITVLSVLPSLDTPVCSVSTKKFNEELSKMSGEVEILTISMDLPFAQKRWCGAEGVERVQTFSDYKYRTFGEAYGCYIKDWGLLCRAVFVLDQSQKVIHAEYVAEISEEPNYEKVFTAVKGLL